MNRSIAFAASLVALFSSAPAFAASDYLLKLDGVEGESAIEVEGWSFGVCNVGQCSTPNQRSVTTARETGSGMATGRTSKPASASWDLATNKGARTAATGGKVNVAAGDLDGDGTADFAYAATQDAVYGLTFTVDASPPVVTKICQAGKIDSATLSRGEESYAVSSVSVLCTKGGGSGAAAASYAKSGINRIDSTPARISTNMTVPKQTQGATFGEKVQSGLASTGAALASGAMTITLTGGQLKHTKTGHVTLLK